MEKRVAVIAIIVEDLQSAEALNGYLHEAAEWIIGRMGIPHKDRGISIMSVAVDGPQDQIAALSGKIGKLPGVSVKTVYQKMAPK